MVYWLFVSNLGCNYMFMMVLVGRASCLASGQPDLHGCLLSVREMLYCLSYALVNQVHLPVHLPCYDLPPLY